MIALIYDGSFDGLLCALARALSRGDEVSLFADGDGPADLFLQCERVITDVARASRFSERFVDVAGEEELETLLLVHASADPRRHQFILGYARSTRLARTGIGLRMGDPLVCAVQKAKGRVILEIGKLLGFVRFSRAAPGFWYAPLAPEANIVGFLGPHFADRFPDEDFLIHDTRRDIGYRGARGVGGVVDLRGLPAAARRALHQESEPDFADQWQTYFRLIAVPERINPRLQTKNMPRRYWANLIEVPGVLNGEGMERKEGM